MNNQQHRQYNQQPQYDENRFFVSENHPHHKELTAIVGNFPFTLVKTGFDFYGIPFYFNDIGIVIGEGDNKIVIAPNDYSKWYDDVGDEHYFDCKAFMFDTIVPALNAAIIKTAVSATNHTSDDALEAYQRLAAIEKKFLTCDYEAEDTTYEKKWAAFQDLKILTAYLPTVSTATCTSIDSLDYYVRIDHKWSKTEKYSFFVSDFEEMLEVFDALRPAYFQHEYSKSSQESTLKYIIEDCQNLANLHACYLDISLDNNSAQLLAASQGSIEFAKYKLFTESARECDIKELIDDIKRCALRKYNKDDKFHKLAYDAMEATLKFLRTV